MNRTIARPWLSIGLFVSAVVLGLFSAGGPAPASAASAAAISASTQHTCALTAAGGVKCWGGNARGQLGDNTTTDRQEPVDVSGLANSVTAIAAGGSHTCALTAAGGVQCWGGNAEGQLGDNTTTERHGPIDVVGLPSMSAISAGVNHTCALTAAGGVKCWGRNAEGQLGDAGNTNSNVPVAVSGLASGVTAVSSAHANHTCALTTAGGVRCWGNNSHGQLGDGKSPTNSNVPVAVSGLASGMTAISTGGLHTCAETTAGGVKCWGGNAERQLGNGGNTNSNVPVDVSGLASGVTAISAGSLHACALTTAGGVKCWGDNLFGGLGNGSFTGNNVPVAVSGLASGVTAIFAGGFHTCALTAAGAVKCWGNNFAGQLGNAGNTNSNVPVTVSTFTGDVTAPRPPLPHRLFIAGIAKA